jgi:hypothetical protein
MMVPMRCAFVAVCGVLCALASAAGAYGHIGVSPGLVIVGNTQTLTLSVHNDLDRPMTGLAVVAPPDLRIVGAETEPAWQSVVEGDTVTWTGGPLAPNTGAAFALDMAVDEAAAAGPVRLEADQLYADNGKRPWPISLTVVPADEDSQLVIWASVAGIFVLATAAIIAVAVLRQGRTLQER